MNRHILGLTATTCVASVLMIGSASGHDTYYDAPYTGPYVGDGYAEWHPEFRSREARYRHRYNDDVRYRHSKRRHRRHYRGGDYEEEFWVGNCKIEREWESDGSYEEEVDCD